ncbi:MAG: hypothetical protein ACP5E4_02850 [Candidatus Aenigmatarchaeota archaeon]
MEAALLIGVEVALFFALIYYLDKKRHRDAAGTLKRPYFGNKIVVDDQNIGQISELFVSELKRMLVYSKNGNVELGVNDLAGLFNNLGESLKSEGRKPPQPG